MKTAIKIIAPSLGVLVLVSLLSLVSVQAQAAGLGRGSQGEQVQALQRLLINMGYLASGLDTGFYGPLTEEAVRQFQADNNISTTGFFGPLTFAAMKEATQSTTPAPNGSTGPQTQNTTRGLGRGDRGEPVRVLQGALIQLGYLGSGLSTGFYGPLTEDAVRRFQVDNGLSATGFFDAATLAKLKEILQAQNPSTSP